MGPDMRPGRVVREVVLPAPPREVWESLTLPEQLSTWLGSRVELDLRPGGAIRLEGRGGTRFGVVETVAPFEHLAFRWRQLIPGRDGPVLGPGTRVEFVLQPEGSGTRLRVEEAALLSEGTSARAAMQTQGATRAPAGPEARPMAGMVSAGNLR